MREFAICLVICVSALLSCQREDLPDEDHFFVENDGASMPVYIRGNLESDVIVLFLHGGPGGNASQATFIPAFQEIETEHPIAYWDQRASGLSQGNPNTATFTIEQFVEDAHYMIEAIKLRYPQKKLFLFGHSWGGALGSALLSTKNYQSDISGFICMNSGHNLEEGLPLSVDWVESFASEQIAANKDKVYWEEVRKWCAPEPDMTDPYNYFQYVEYLVQTDAYIHDKQDVMANNPTLNDILNSRLNLAILTGGSYLSKNFNILEMNLSDEMKVINIPTLVIWGRHDGVNTLAMGYDAYSSIGTDTSKKELVILENSAHEGYLEEPKVFKNVMLDFIARYK
jgi:proline-specific peptidase